MAKFQTPPVTASFVQCRDPRVGPYLAQAYGGRYGERALPVSRWLADESTIAMAIFDGRRKHGSLDRDQGQIFLDEINSAGENGHAVLFY